MRTGVVRQKEMTVSKLTDAQLTGLLTEYATENAEVKELLSGMANRGNGFLGSHWKFRLGSAGTHYWEHKDGTILRSSRNW
jgi:hypothetical protein